MYYQICNCPAYSCDIANLKKSFCIFLFMIFFLLFSPFFWLNDAILITLPNSVYYHYLSCPHTSPSITIQEEILNTAPISRMFHHTHKGPLARCMMRESHPHTHAKPTEHAMVTQHQNSEGSSPSHYYTLLLFCKVLECVGMYCQVSH